MKKVKLDLKAVPSVNKTTIYAVKRVTNSVEWTPGDYLKQTEVAALCSRSYLDITVTK